LIRDV